MLDKKQKLKIATHDDQIILRCERHKVGLMDGWKNHTFKDEETISHYWNGYQGHLSKTWNATEKEEALKYGAFPCYAQRRNFGRDSMMLVYNHHVDFHFNDLYSDFKSRSKKCLDELVKASVDGIISYNGKAPRGSETHVEAMRQRMKRDWLIAEYEHNLIILDPGLGNKLLKALFPLNQDKTRLPGETVYIKGYSSNTTLKVKVYDMAGKLDMDDTRVKIEVTLRKDWLKSNKIRKPEEFTQQPEIQLKEKISKLLIREWRSLFKKAGLTKDLARLMGTTQANVFEEIIKSKYTLTEMERQGYTDQVNEFKTAKKIEPIKLKDKKYYTARDLYQMEDMELTQKGVM